MGIMTDQHPRWNEFMDKLVGAEGCDFTEDENGKGSWICYSDHRLAIAILETMGNIDIPASTAHFAEHGGHCDCEIVFNMDTRPEPDDDDNTEQDGD